MLEGRRRIVGGARMERPRLDDRAARCGQPVEPLRLAHGRERAAHDRAGGDRLDERELLADGIDVAARSERQERIAVERRPHGQVALRPAEEDQPGVEELAPLDVRHHADHGVRERATRRRHAAPACGPAPPPRPRSRGHPGARIDSVDTRRAPPRSRRSARRAATRPAPHRRSRRASRDSAARTDGHRRHESSRRTEGERARRCARTAAAHARPDRSRRGARTAPNRGR